MPHTTSNNPSKMFNGAYEVEILKIARVTCTKAIFVNHCSTVIFRLINQEKMLAPLPRPSPKHLVDTLQLLVSSMQHY